MLAAQSSPILFVAREANINSRPTMLFDTGTAESVNEDIYIYIYIYMALVYLRYCRCRCFVLDCILVGVGHLGVSKNNCWRRECAGDQTAWNIQNNNKKNV